MTVPGKQCCWCAVHFRPPITPRRLYGPLRVGYGAVAVIERADKFTNLLTDWARALMMGVGVCEMIVGLAVLGGPTRVVRVAAYITVGSLVLIAGAVGLAGFYYTAVSDLLLAIGAYALGALVGLSALRESGGSA